MLKGKANDIHLTQQIRIFPSEKDEGTLWLLSELSRRVYNMMLSERIKCWENDYDITSYDCYDKLPKLKKEKFEFKLSYAKVLQTTTEQVFQDFKSFLSIQRRGDKATYPRFKGKKYFTNLVYNQLGFKFTEGNISFSNKFRKLKLGIPKKFNFEKVKQVTIYHKDNKYFVSIVYEVETKPYKDNGKYQAIDLGVMNIVSAVNTEGKFLQIKNQRPNKYWEKKIEEVQSKRDHCKKGSKRWKIYHKSLCVMKRKCSNQKKDFHHKLSRKMVDNTKSNTIIVGDLSSREMGKRKKGKENYKGARTLNRATQNSGTFGRFVDFLTYKAELVGKKVVKINECGTTKTCCICGKQENRQLWERVIKCDCGNTLDRDLNSSINIMVRFLLQNAKWTGYQLFADNLRQTGIPIGLHSQEAILNT